jgi:hypothetical protein
MGVAKQIPQLQPKAKERKSKKERRGRGLYRLRHTPASTGLRGRTPASVRTRWREKLNEEEN